MHNISMGYAEISETLSYKKYLPVVRVVSAKSSVNKRANMAATPDHRLSTTPYNSPCPQTSPDSFISAGQLEKIAASWDEQFYTSLAAYFLELSSYVLKENIAKENLGKELVLY